MPWSVEVTDQFHDWYQSLDEAHQDLVAAAVGALEEAGPGLGRPWADTIRGSHHANMKELRPSRSLRILFAFDPRRTAILLLGGDKKFQWTAWYDAAIPTADALYDEHLRQLQREGRTP